MSLLPRMLLAYSIIVTSFTCVFNVASAEQPVVPRYKLKVGQELTYTGKSEFKYNGGSFSSEVEWNVWVAKANEDGSWFVVVKQVTKQSPDSPPQVVLAHFDLYPDGRHSTNSSLGYRFDPSALFVKLPTDEKEIASGWTVVNETSDTTSKHQRNQEASDTGKFVVDAERKSPMDEIYLSTHKLHYVFDDQGLVERVDTENTQNYGFEGKGTGKTELKSVTAHDAAWTDSFEKAMTAYFKSSSEYEHLTEQAMREPAKTEAFLTKAKELIDKARDEAKQELVKVQFEILVASHEQMAGYARETAKLRGETVGKEAFAFETTDFDGNDHKLKEYRGKVVILDFWYRGCGWCIRAMPQIKQIAEKYDERQVVVFGMNTDRKEEDAQFVIEKMGLDYPNLKAEGIPSKYNVQGFPTLIIVDQKGVVHDIHVGYSADLAENLSATIDKLMAGI